MLEPSALKALFADQEVQLADLRMLRDQSLDQLYGNLRTNGTKTQRNFVDRYIQSRDQARQLGEQLGTLLERLPVNAIDVDGSADQIIAAVALAKLKIAPVITIRIPFGRDNHADAGLNIEATETISGVANIGRLWEELGSSGLRDQVTFAMMNVFGRTLQANGGGGRNHNRHHCVMVAFGPKTKGGVYGGLTADGRCLAIDPSTGAGRSDAAIAVNETMESAGKSLATALGHAPADVDNRIHGGRVVEAFVA